MTNSVRAPSALIDAFWIEKYLTFSQDHQGVLTPTDHIFLAEYVLRGDVGDAKLFRADFFRAGAEQPLQTFTGEDRLWCNRVWVNRKVRSFDSLAEMDGAYPATSAYFWRVSGSHISGEIKPVRIGGTAGRTQVPKPHPMRLSQRGMPVRDFNAIDSSLPLTIEWDRFENAKAGLAIDDTIFVFIDDCRGDVVYFGGLPMETERIPFDSTSVTIAAGTLNAGQPYTVFFSQCRMVDQDDGDGLINVAVNSFGIELDLHTAGVNLGEPCPVPRRMAPFRWTRKARATDGLETWPTIADDNRFGATQLGIVGAMYSLGLGIVAISSYLWVRQVSRRACMAAGLVLLASSIGLQRLFSDRAPDVPCRYRSGSRGSRSLHWRTAEAHSEISESCLCYRRSCVRQSGQNGSCCGGGSGVFNLCGADGYSISSISRPCDAQPPSSHQRYMRRYAICILIHSRKNCARRTLSTRKYVSTPAVTLSNDTRQMLSRRANGSLTPRRFSAELIFLLTRSSSSWSNSFN
jgi:hypothetical protein